MAGNPFFTPEEEAEISKRYRDGESTIAIAESLNCGRTAVQGLLKRLGEYEGRAKLRLLTPGQEPEVVARYQAGESAREIGVSFGCGPKAIQNVLKRYEDVRRREFKGFTPEQEAEILARYANREGANTIARDYPCTRGAIQTLLEKHGVYQRRRFQGFTPEERDEIFAQYRAGTTPCQIGRNFKVAQTTVERILKRGEVWVPPSSLERVGSRYTVEQKLEMAERYKAGDSLYAIGKAYEALPQLVWKILNAQGVEFRDKAWRGGKVKTEGGKYTAVWMDKEDSLFAMANVTGYALEHRLVMARSLGHVLSKGETVHHINGDTTDNRIENLQLRKGAHGKGVVMACLDCGSHNVEAVPISD